MAGSVETVFADAVFFVVIIRNGIEIRFRRHGLVELRIEHRHIRNGLEDFLTGFDSHQVGGVVQRSEREAFADDVFHPRIDFHGHGDFFAAMQHAVPDRGNFRRAFQHADFRIAQFGANRFQRIAVIADFRRFFRLEAVGTFVNQIRGVGADAFDLSGGNDFFFAFLHIEKREFQR